MYNMYALERNAWKYRDRDKRTQKIQLIEYDYLAPDTINELFDALTFLEKLQPNQEGIATITGWENTERETQVIKVPQAIKVFRELIQYYCTTQLFEHFRQNKFSNFDEFKKSLTTRLARAEWMNVGSQLIKKSSVEKLKLAVKSNKIKSWNELHEFYLEQGDNYIADKLQHAYTGLLEILKITARQFTPDRFRSLVQQTITTRTWMCKGIYDARAKDYSNPYRKMVYETTEEMNKVVGKLEDNSFIQDQLQQLEMLKKAVKLLIKKIN